MTMAGRFGGQASGWRWRRGFAPLVVLVALLADYTSPAALWTAALPLMFMAVLLTFRERTAALVVLCLSSWIFVPVAAGTKFAVDSARGQHQLYGVEFDLPGVEEPDFNRCFSNALPIAELPVPEVPVVHALAVRVGESFAGFYNMLTVSSGRLGSFTCIAPAGDALIF
jgi:hypothetical protein